MSVKSAKQTRYIFVSGGVISGLGKGIATASLGMILKQRGLHVEFVKCDPYLNVDAGTMNPLEHGEVFVTVDGYEMDMDAGHYERFLDQPITRSSGITSGQIYLNVITNERALKYNGECVDPVPYLVDEIMHRLITFTEKSEPDVLLVELGGTVGEYQNEIYFEAERRLKRELGDKLMHIHLIYLPVPESIGEMKTKPGQQSVRLLNNLGIFPDMIISRAYDALDARRIHKLALGCGLREEMVFSAPDVDSIYEVPLNFEAQHMSDRILKSLNLKAKDWDKVEWEQLVGRIGSSKRDITIGVVGKYFATGNYNLEDAYASVIESIKHACWDLGVNPVIHWINSEKVEENPHILSKLDAIIVPGGFGSRGVQGKIKAITYARERMIPYLGLCYGMQLAVVEFARNVCGIKKAHTTEIDAKTPDPVIHIMPDQEKKLLTNDYGGTMRLGSWACKLMPGTIAKESYRLDEDVVQERHRHRYEFNNTYRKELVKKGLIISGTTLDDQLVEIVELPKSKHPFFVGVQFHPEFQSRPLHPHPLFKKLIETAIHKKFESENIRLDFGKAFEQVAQ